MSLNITGYYCRLVLCCILLCILVAGCGQEATPLPTQLPATPTLPLLPLPPLPTVTPTPTVTSFALPAGAKISSVTFANCQFRQLWEYSDKLINEGGTNERGFSWGPASFGAFEEPYQEAPGGQRLVQYFDKGRMESLPGGTKVSAGLLTKEMVTGQLQVGDASFESRPSSTMPVAGDAISSNPAPDYASLRRISSFAPGENRDVSRLGQPVLQSLNNQAETATLTVPPAQLNISQYEPGIGHNIPEVFVNFQQQSGRIWWNNSRYVRQPVYGDNPAANLFGLPISEPFWIKSRTGGQDKDVLLQLFERRILTYTPSNPDPYKVEMSNLGQHYFQWRYGATPPGGFSGSCQAQNMVSLPRAANHEQIYLPSLMFHQIIKAPDDPFANSPELLVQILDWLAANNYNPVTVAQAADFLLEGIALPPKPVILRFDDGWKSQFFAAEEMQKRGMTATFFVMTGAPGPYMASPDFVKLEKMGFEIGAHTRSHARLTTVKNPKIEIEGNRDDLAKVLGHPLRSFAYPYGLHNKAVHEMVKTAKFDIGLTVDQGALWRRSTMYAQPNITMEGIATLDQFIRRLNSVR